MHEHPELEKPEQWEQRIAQPEFRIEVAGDPGGIHCLQNEKSGRKRKGEIESLFYI
jgi:hypothetical protein